MDCLLYVAMEWVVRSLHDDVSSSASKRIKDPWYSTLIDECRAGNLSDEKYNCLHGYPTLKCGSWLDDTAPPKCLCQQQLDVEREGMKAKLEGRASDRPAGFEGRGSFAMLGGLSRVREQMRRMHEWATPTETSP